MGLRACGCGAGGCLSRILRDRQLHNARLRRRSAGGALAAFGPDHRDERRVDVRMVHGGHLRGPATHDGTRRRHVGPAMIDLYYVPLPVIFLVGLALIWGGSEIGWRLGQRRDGHSPNIGTLESATLGLLALIIGFTFAMALSRFEARRDAVVQEANAIVTTALRARFLPEPQRTESLKLLRDYVQVRIEAIRSGHSLAELRATILHSNAVQ